MLDAITHAARYSNRVGATADEIAAHLAYAGQPVPQRSVIARRCTDLRDRGLIKDSGSTRPGTSGRQAICWILTDRGRAS